MNSANGQGLQARNANTFLSAKSKVCSPSSFLHPKYVRKRNAHPITEHCASRSLREKVLRLFFTLSHLDVNAAYAPTVRKKSLVLRRASPCIAKFHSGPPLAPAFRMMCLSDCIFISGSQFAPFQERGAAVRANRKALRNSLRALCIFRENITSLHGGGLSAQVRTLASHTQ